HDQRRRNLKPHGRGNFICHKPRSEPCRMAQDRLIRSVRNRRRPLLTDQSGQRTPPVPSKGAPKTRKEATRGTSLSPRLKPSLGISSGRRTTTSTPSIISERCLRTEKRRKRFSASSEATQY